MSLQKVHDSIQQSPVERNAQSVKERQTLSGAISFIFHKFVERGQGWLGDEGFDHRSSGVQGLAEPALPSFTVSDTLPSSDNIYHGDSR